MKYLLHLLLTFFLLFPPVDIFTQNDTVIKNKYRTAENFESISDYASAMPILKELVALDPENSNFNFKLAMAIIETKSLENPLSYLEKACVSISPRYVSSYKQRSAPAIAWKYLAKEYQLNYKFAEAEKAYTSYLSFVSKKDAETQKAISLQLEYCASGLQLIKKPLKVAHLDFGPNFMLNYTAHSPVFSPDESIYIFASPYTPVQQDVKNRDANTKYDDDIYYTYYLNGKWSVPEPLTNLNTDKNEAPISISPDGQQLIIYRDDDGDGNLYYSDLLEGKVWSKPKRFPGPINTIAQETHATISADGNKIYFTSDRKGGKGGLDIYMCMKTIEGRWTKAYNLSQINTAYNEESPHLQANDNTLYFSSDQPKSLGGLDVFKCVLEQDSIAKNIENLGYPINTADNDMFFKTSVDGKRAFYTSPCRTKKSELDLSIVELLDAKLLPSVVVKGLVIGSDNEPLKNCKVMLFDMEARDIIDSNSTNESDGYYTFMMSKQRKYFASFEKDDYVYYSKPFKITKYFSNLTYTNTIYLDPIHLSDSTLRQSKAGFKVYKTKLKTGEIPASLVEKTRNMSKEELEKTSPDDIDIIALEDKQDVATVSRLSNKVGMAKDVYKPEKPNVVGPPVVAVRDSSEEDKPIVQRKPVLKSNIDLRAIADSLERAGIKNFNDGRYVSCVETLEKALNIYEKLGDQKEQIVCLNYMANAMYKSDRFSESIGLHEQALGIIRAINNRAQEGQKLEAIGDIYAETKDKGNALGNYYKSLDIRRELKDKPGELSVLNSIAKLNYDDKDFDGSIKYLNLAAKENAGNDRALADIYNRLGLSYHGKHEYDSALNNFEKAVKIAEKYGDKKNLSIYMNNKGNVYYDLVELNKALDMYTKSLNIKREINYEEGIAISLHNIGNVYRKLDKKDDALNNYNNSNDIAERIGYTDLMGKNHFGLMQVYRDLGNYNKALVHFKKYVAIRVPSLEREGVRQITQQSNKFEMSDKDIAMLKRKMQKQELFALLEIEKQKREIELLKNTQKRQKLFQAVIAGGLVAMLALFFLVVFRYRTKRKGYKILEMKNAEISQKNEEISTLRENLSEINAQLAKLSIVASETSNGVAIFDKDLRFEWVNKGYTTMYGYEIDDLVKPGNNMYSGISDPAISGKIETAIAQNTPLSFDVLKARKDGGSLWVSVSLTPIHIEGELYKVIFIESDINYIILAEQEINRQKDEISSQRDDIQKHRDVAMEQKELIQKKKNELEETIDELQQTQKKLVESEKMASLGNLVAGISHEINTPVGIGIAAITTLNTKTLAINSLFEEKKMKQSDLVTYLATAKDAAKLIQTNLNRTGDLVKSFKRISVDEITEQRRQFNLNHYLVDIIKSLEPKINEKVVDVQIICPLDIEINSYPGVYAQIITNLVTNSILHGFKNREGGRITIECTRQSGSLLMSYKDDGVGMIPEVVEKVFNPFFTTNMQTGNGLGMNIVYNIVTQKLQGEIFCESEPGKGVTFRIECPLETKATEKTPMKVVS